MARDQPRDPDVNELRERARLALRRDDAAALRAVLGTHPQVNALIADPAGEAAAAALTSVRSREMLDVLLDAGIDINARTKWWAGGFGVLDCAEPGLALYAIERGAIVTPHAAARLDLLDKLKELIGADPDLVHARGGDGQTPLHLAATVEVAEYLLDCGADIDALDVDHASTPAQYMVRSRPEVARYLVARGCRTDILMAAALDDAALVRKHLDHDVDAIRMRVSDEYFPMVGGENGGTIYQWELGWYVSACQVARAFENVDLYQLLVDASPAEERLLNACWLRDRDAVGSLLEAEPTVAAALPPAGRRHVAHAARNNDTEAARLMLSAGLPVDTYSQHHATPLHWAAWHGNADLVRLLMAHRPSLEDRDNDFRGTPLGWAMHGSENGWQRERGDYAATVEALFAAGAQLPDAAGGAPEVRQVLLRHGVH